MSLTCRPRFPSTKKTGSLSTRDLRPDASRGNPAVITESGYRWELAFSVAVSVGGLLGDVANEVIELRPRVGLVEGCQYQRQALQDLHAGAGHGKGKNVLSGLQRMILWQAFDVGR